MERSAWVFGLGVVVYAVFEWRRRAAVSRPPAEPAS